MFLLYKTNQNIYKNITLKYTLSTINEKTAVVQHHNISHSLHHFLIDIKSKIDDCEQWDTIKKITNPYEYIHTVIPSKNYTVSKYKPISRSYFKLIEIINLFKLLPFSSVPIHTFHLAEGPGGFIEATINYRKNSKDSYVGMTLINPNDTTIPNWKKSRDNILNSKNIYLEKGYDGTGDLLKYDNLIYCSEKYNSSMDFITADGGFDFSVDFNNQEQMMVPLLFAEVCFALLTQKAGGTFILKIFDCFMDATIDILYILSAFYNKVYIVKPKTSRLANSEKYIICKDFCMVDIEYKQYFIHTFKTMSNNLPVIPTRFLSIDIPSVFKRHIEEINVVFGQQQLENIHSTILLNENRHKNEKIESLKRANINKCIHWCIQNNVPYHNIGY